MRSVPSVDQLPPVAIASVGAYVAGAGALSYVERLGYPGPKLGFLAEAVLLVELVLAGSLVAVGVREYGRPRPVLSVSGLAGVGTLWTTFAVDFYRGSTVPRVVAGVGLVAGVALAVWAALTIRWDAGDG